MDFIPGVTAPADSWPNLGFAFKISWPLRIRLAASGASVERPIAVANTPSCFLATCEAIIRRFCGSKPAESWRSIPTLLSADNELSWFFNAVASSSLSGLTGTPYRCDTSPAVRLRALSDAGSLGLKGPGSGTTRCLMAKVSGSSFKPLTVFSCAACRVPANFASVPVLAPLAIARR